MPNTANALTGLRLVLVVPFLTAIVHALDGGTWARTALVLLYAIAAATDFLDGRVARHDGTASSRGQLLDHGADVLFVGSSLVLFAASGRVSWWAPVAMLAAVAAYAHAVWREAWTRHGAGADLRRARNPVGHAAGVLNYVLVGVLAVELAAPRFVPGWLVGVVAAATIVANALAVAGRIASARGEVRLADPRPRA